MTLNIPDDIFKQLGRSEREVLIEFACRLYDAQKLSKPLATRLLGISRDEFDEELRKRSLPIIRYTQEMFEQDMAAVGKVEKPLLKSS